MDGKKGFKDIKWFLLSPPVGRLIVTIIAIICLTNFHIPFLKTTKDGILFLLGVVFIVDGLTKSLINFAIQKEEKKQNFYLEFDSIFTGIIFLTLSLL
jgi:hypothetical protein